MLKTLLHCLFFSHLLVLLLRSLKPSDSCFFTLFFLYVTWFFLCKACRILCLPPELWNFPNICLSVCFFFWLMWGILKINCTVTLSQFENVYLFILGNVLKLFCWFPSLHFLCPLCNSCLLFVLDVVTLMLVAILNFSCFSSLFFLDCSLFDSLQFFFF